MKNSEQKLLLFLSVDVIGSTAYKNKSSEIVQHWLETFLNFYKDFPVHLDKKFNKIKNQCEKKIKVVFEKNPVLWKSLGDELIFKVALTDSEQLKYYIQAFQESVLEYHKIINKEPALGLKATAWLAGFPVCNTELTFESDKKTKDYIGPSMDIGFRLGKFSSKRRFVISLDLAYMLSRYIGHPKIRYEGKRELKGVLDNKPYPVFWIDMEPEGNLEDKLFPEIKFSERDDIKLFVEEFIRQTGKPLMLPFIDGDRTCNKKPEDYDKDLEAILKLKEKINDEEPDTEGSPQISENDLKQDFGKLTSRENSRIDLGDLSEE